MSQANKKKFSVKGLFGSKKNLRAPMPDDVKASNSKVHAEAEAESVLQVDVDDRTMSVTSGDTKTASTLTNDRAVDGFLASSNTQYVLKVVLLLIDPETRRFELLQLEYDSENALVADVLTQIPVAVTEDVLKKQAYVGICGSAGSEMNSATLLSDLCKGNDVLVAIPDGMSASECARLARPILNDEKVIGMLKATGIDGSGWQEAATKSSPRELTRVPTAKLSDEKIEKPKEATKKKATGGGSTFALLFFVLTAIILQFYHHKISEPIVPGQVLPPGMWVSRCGLLTMLPSCNNTILQMGHDGVLSFYDAKGQLEWKMEGAVCKSEEECISGLEMREDNKLAIGGKVVQSVNVKKNAEPISPWPFAEQPKLKVIHARK